MLIQKTSKEVDKGMHVFFSAFIIIVAIVCFIDLTRIGYYSSDAIAEMNYAQLVWEKKTLFPDGWFFTTETFVHRPFFFPALFYGITGNFFLSYVCGIIAGGVLFSIISYYYFRFLDVGKAASFFGICCLWSMFYWWLGLFVLFGYYYAGIFGTVILTIWAYQSGNRWLRILSVFSAVMMGMASLRMLVFLYVPLLVVALLDIICRKGRENLSEIFFALKLMIGNVMGYFFLIHVLIKYFHVSWGESHIEFFSSGNEILEAGVLVGKRLYEVLQLSEPVMLILVLISIFAASRIFVSGRYTKRTQALMFFFFSVTFIILASSLLKGMNGTARYYVSITFFVIIALMFLIDELIQKCREIAIVAGIAIVMFGTYNNLGQFLKPSFFADEHVVADYLINENPVLYRSIYLQSILSDVAQYLMEENIERAYATYWYAEPIKLYSNGRIEAGHFDQDLVPYTWGTESRLYEPGGYIGTVAVVVQKDEMENFSVAAKEILQRGKLKRVIKDEYFVYFFEENPILLR